MSIVAGVAMIATANSAAWRRSRLAIAIGGGEIARDETSSILSR
jgi:hypothetical protein